MADIDVSTGLPVVPEDYRWVVGEDILLGAYVALQRQTQYVSTATRKHWWSKPESTDKMVWGNVWSEHVVDELTPASVLRTAVKVMEASEVNERRKQLFGVYPPKKLEA